MTDFTFPFTFSGPRTDESPEDNHNAAGGSHLRIDDGANSPFEGTFEQIRQARRPKIRIRLDRVYRRFRQRARQMHAIGPLQVNPGFAPRI